MIPDINNKNKFATNKKNKRKLLVQLFSGGENDDISNNNTNSKKNNDDNDPYNNFAGPLTLQSCQCPHIKEYLPTQLSSLSSSLSSDSSNNIIHQLHLLQFLQEQEQQEQQDAKMFGEEELRRMMAIQSLESYHPLLSPYQRYQILQQQQQPPSLKTEDDNNTTKQQQRQQKENNTIKQNKNNNSNNINNNIIKKESVGGRNAKQLPNLPKQQQQQYNDMNKAEIIDEEKLLFHKKKEDLILQYREILNNRKNNISAGLPSKQQQSQHPLNNTATTIGTNRIANKNDYNKILNGNTITPENEELLEKVSCVDRWLEIYRKSRERYWKRQQLQFQKMLLLQNNNEHVQQQYSYNNNQLECQLCNDDDDDNDEIQCCGVIDDDQMMICLECGMIGCGPGSIYPKSKQCMLTHLLSSGHNFAVTCGNKATLYCFKCGDFIYHDAVTSEKLCIDISQHLPHLSWKESSNTTGPLQRSAKPGRFLINSELGYNSGVLWTGMVATYPSKNVLSLSLVEAAKKSWRRFCIFRTLLTTDSMRWGDKTIQLSLKLQKKKQRNSTTIQAPVGMYNLGNTCFMSCILQCLIHCPPLQNYFLSDIGHDYQACQLLRKSHDYTTFLPTTTNNISNNSNNLKKAQATSTCLACEMDQIYLQMLGSCIGHDCIDALEDYKKPTVVADTFDTLPSDPIIYSRDNKTNHNNINNNTTPQGNEDNTSVIAATTDINTTSFIPTTSSSINNNKQQGKPFIPINFLTAAWKVEEMKHLKGYEQRDAHEFLHAFLDTCGRDMKLYRDVVSAMAGRQRHQQQQSSSEDNNKNFIQSLFGGTLRSVLFCEKCGCKRSQIEPYLIVSLPFQKTKASSTANLPNNVTTSSPSDVLQSSKTSSSSNTTTTNINNNNTTNTSNVASGITRSKSKDRKVDIQTCLENFTVAQSLGDCVHCPSCNSFTPTLQQHTFATFPKVLCLHLKRFDAVSNRKITDPVIFPAYGLDMGPFLPHWRELVVQDDASNPNDNDSSTSNTSKNEQHQKQQKQKQLWNESSPKVLYDLFGTVNHSGTLHQGHYVANVKVNSNWFHCNDSFVSHSNSGPGSCAVGGHDNNTINTNGEKEVLESEGAYILFYIKR